LLVALNRQLNYANCLLSGESLPLMRIVTKKKPPGWRLLLEQSSLGSSVSPTVMMATHNDGLDPIRRDDLGPRDGPNRVPG